MIPQNLLKMAWIETFGVQEATGVLKRIYDKVKGPNDKVDNVLKIHSLRPHTLKGHMTLYKSVLHNSNNQLPKWYLECVGVYVSLLNKCDYCVQHHLVGMKRNLDDDQDAYIIFSALKTEVLKDVLDEKFCKGLEHARTLTLNHTKIDRSEIDKMRKAGYSDGEILELNQVTCYFNYVNRMVVGLGVTTDGDVIGLSPNDSNNPDDWSHS